MCLGAPGRVLSLSGEGDDQVGVVDFGGVTRVVSMSLVDEPVAVGDHVLVHVGFALRRIPEEEVQETLRLIAELSEPEAGPETGPGPGPEWTG